MGAQVIDPSRTSPGFELLEHVPIPTYVFEVRGDDFILQDVNAAARTQNPALAGLRGSSMNHLYQDQPQAISDARRCVAERGAVVCEDAAATLRPNRGDAVRASGLRSSFARRAHMVVYMQDISTPQDHRGGAT